MVAYCLLTRTPFVAVESNTPKIGALLTDVFGERSRLIEPDCLATFRPEAFDHFTVTASAAISAFLAAGRDDSGALTGRSRESEERRVGNEWCRSGRSWWCAIHYKKKTNN